MIFLLTNYFLDISSAIVWWITKNSIKIVYNGITYLFTKEEIENNATLLQEYDNFTKEEIIELKKEIQTLKQLLVQNKENI